MKLLLDTCVFLWLIQDEPQLSRRSRLLFSDASNEVYFSVVSLWEILVKQRLGRLKLPDAAPRFITEQREQHGIASLSLSEESVYHLNQLPDLHRDPFDRMLICQAIAHGLTLLTPDEMIQRYPIATAW